MKRLAWLALLPMIAGAAGRDDYARQWPLGLDRAGEGAYRVVLDDTIYRSAHLPTLADVDVYNADGVAVPTTLFAADQPLASAPGTVDLPWFALPAGKAGQAQDIAVISERTADGRVRRVETRVSDGAGAPVPPARAWLVDASGLRQPIVALLLDWPASDTPIDIAYRVEGSDDLRDWRELQSHAQLLDLTRGGQQLRQVRIPLDGSARYLRLSPLQDAAAPALSGVRAELPAIAQAQDWRWVELAAKRVEERGVSHFEFDLGGRFPVERADIALPGNNASEWTLQSRDGDDAPWQMRAGPWVSFRLDAAGRADRSPPQPLQGVVRDRYWRLLPSASSPGRPPADAPTLRLGYRPEVVVFVAQGAPPYVLVAGSARARRHDAPLPQILDAMRAQRGADWQPGRATAGPAQPLAGSRALEPAQRDWKAWLLWAVLIAGALIVAAFAFTLLRGPKQPG